MGSEIVGGVWADRRTEWQHLQARSASTRFYCKICNIACSGQQHYESHVGGKKHRRRVKQKQLEDAKSDPSLKRPEVVKCAENEAFPTFELTNKRFQPSQGRSEAYASRSGVS